VASLPVIGLAHGSRHAGVESSIASLMAAVSAGAGAPARSAFLDLTDPNLTAVAIGLAREGYDEAIVVPLLFTPAFHANVDVPEAARTASEVAGVRLVLADILGTSDDMLDVVAASAAASGIDDRDSVLLFSVGSSDAAANARVHDLAARFATRRTGAVRAGFGTAEPRGRAVLAELAPPMAILPMFLSPGLLLEPLQRQATALGLVMAPPLGDRVAPLVVARYERARGALEPAGVRGIVGAGR
jgi:sirohydrochlorin ferrochelatase